MFLIDIFCIVKLLVTVFLYIYLEKDATWKSMLHHMGLICSELLCILIATIYVCQNSDLYDLYECFNLYE